MRKSRIRTKKSNRFSYTLAILIVFGLGVVTVLSSCYEKSWHFNWNGIRTQIKDTIYIAEKDGIDNYRVGYSNRKSIQYERQNWLMKTATIQELRKLTAYPNGTIKVIAYQGLLQDPLIKDKTTILLSAILDNTFYVYYSSGCTVDRMRIGQYLIRYVLLGNIIYFSEEMTFESKFNFTKEQTKKNLSEYTRVLDQEGYN